MIKKHSTLIFGAILMLAQLTLAQASTFSNVRPGDRVVLIKPMNDGNTYYVQTPGGLEIWRDRDIHTFAGYQETCKVIQSRGNEVLLFVPIMNANYWFTVKQTNLR